MTFVEELIGRLVNSTGEERESLLECAALEENHVLKTICILGRNFTVVDLLKNLPRKEYIRCLELSNKCAARKEIETAKTAGKTEHLKVLDKYAK